MDLSTLLASFASAFTQDRRQLTLSLGAGSIAAEQLLPLALDGEEGVSRPYRFTVRCLSPDGAIELKTLLGLPARIGIEDAQGGESIRCGVVSQAKLEGADGGFAKYALTIEPPFALLRHRRTSRVFQDLTVPQIIEQILTEHQQANPAFARGQALALQVGQADARSYCLQYRESDYDFIVRLMHEEGYAWRFEHVDGDAPQVKLVVFDDVYSLPPAQIERARFHRADATEEEDGLTDWQAARQIVPGQVALATFDYQPVSTQQVGDQSRIEQGQDGAALQSTLQDYDPQGLYYAGGAEPLSRYAQLRQQAYDLQAKQFEGGGTLRGLTAGQWFRLDDHPAHETDSAQDREFVVTGQTLHARNNLPADLAQQLSLAAPGLLAAGLATDAALQENGAGKGRFLPSPLAGEGQGERGRLAASESPFTTRIQAQRRGIPLTPAYAHTAQAKPTSLGVQTATVVGPAEPTDQAADEIYTDAQGRIKVQFHWQRPQEHAQFGANLDDKSSCWLRVAMPSAGAGFGHQFIPRIGQEVLVDFIEGDIDRPVITGVLYNGSHPTPDFSGAGALPANKTLSGIKSKEHQGGGYNELLFDDTPGEVRAKLSSESGKTQLNQGFLTHPRSHGKAQPRGDGFELRTDQHGAIRAAHGLLLSTEAQNGAGGKQLAREHAQSQLDAALSLSQALAETASGQLADTMETGPDEIGPDNAKTGKKPDGHLQHHVDALKAWEAGSNTDKDGKTAKEQAGQQPLLILSGPAGIASLTEQSQTVSAGTNLNLVAQRDANHTTGRRWIHNVGQHISLFVAGVKDKVALKLIAAKGKVQVQAQSDAMELTADKDVTITSVKQKIQFNGKQEILLTSGGAYVRIKGGKIELHAPGTVSFKGASHDWSGGTSLGQMFNSMPDAKFDNKYQILDEHTGQPLINQKYKIIRQSGEAELGITDSNGFTHVVKNPDVAEKLQLHLVMSKKKS
ncbi:type VI secretion system Vgr family protein [Chromobacterium paludis]|uniref:Type VI secretion system tip protein VgrG n=1 Tax=Chromobacterium paludis TaxID=2605945 RepID=A0A5C1DG00_9NEIS|nr:type VI secretion system Vgr family protein [Chromobacterium paludis]QEL54877.1 type VI secretion system tip protein VgrG [Chromobacterium paludis]